MWPFTTSQIPVAPAPHVDVAPLRHLEDSALAEVSDLEKHMASPKSLSTQTAMAQPHERLSMPFESRARLTMSAAFFAGFCLGGAQGGNKMGDRYRAENAHRLPVSQTGWFLYHKTKNYHVARGAIKEGFRYGFVCTAWWTLFMCTEEVIDRARARVFGSGDEDVIEGQRDVGSTVIGAMTVSAVYSRVKRLDHFATARTAGSALRFSLAYGLAQDFIATLRGNPPTYVRWLRSSVS